MRPVSTRRRVAAIVALVSSLLLAAAVVADPPAQRRQPGDRPRRPVRGRGRGLVAHHRADAASRDRDRRGGRRAGAMVFAVANALDGADRIAARSVLVAALLAITLGSARAAMVRDLHQLDVRVHAGGPPRRPVLLCNPWSGGGKVERFGLVRPRRRARRRDGHARPRTRPGAARTRRRCTRRRLPRHGRRRRFPSARRVHRGRARPSLRVRQRGNPQPLRARPRPQPRRPP